MYSITDVRKVQEYRGKRIEPNEGFFIVGPDRECILKWLNRYCKKNRTKMVYAYMDPIARPGKPVPLPEYNVTVKIKDSRPEGIELFYKLLPNGVLEKCERREVPRRVFGKVEASGANE